MNKSDFLKTGTEKPQTGPGKLVGSMCAVAGIFSLILPIPIVVNRDDSVQRGFFRGLGPDSIVINIGPKTGLKTGPRCKIEKDICMYYLKAFTSLPEFWPENWC